MKDDTRCDILNHGIVTSPDDIIRTELEKPTAAFSPAPASSSLLDMQFATALDKVTLPASESAKVTRYADFPVSPSLGTADISIPIYEINTGRIRVPISLQYNTSGIKVNEVSGPVGLGWHLNAGGVITRTVCGVPDGNSYYLAPREIITEPGGTHHWPSDQVLTGILKDYAEDPVDTQYDRYSYNFLGHTGSFIIYNGVIIPLNATDLIIETMTGGFRITDTSGTSYEFTEQETSSRAVICASPTPSAPSNTQDMGYDVNTVTGWHLTRINTMDGTDEVTFNYDEAQSPVIAQRESFHKTYQLAYRFMNSPLGTHWWKTHTMYSTVYAPDETPDIVHSEWSYIIEDGFTPKVLSSISFRGGSVIFTHNPNGINSNGNYRRSYHKHLTDITVKDSSASTILEANLSYTTTYDKRELLGRVTFKGGDGAETDRRVMTYYSQNTNMQPTTQDLFGYYNGILNTTLVPFNLFPDLETINEVHGDRSYNATLAKALSLESISTGSGATTVLYYEGNSVPGIAGSVLPTIGIGIRVARIVTKDGSTVVRVRRFAYSNPEITIPAAAFSHNRFISTSEYNIKLDTPTEITQDHTWEGTFGPERHLTVTIGDQSVCPGASLESALIIYGRVSETVENQSGSEWARTEYTFNTIACVRRTMRYSETPSYDHDTYFAETYSQAWGFHMHQRIPHYITRNGHPNSVRVSEPEMIFEEGNCPMMTMPTCVKTYSKKEGSSEKLISQTTSEYIYINEAVKTGYSVRNLLSINMSGYQNSDYSCIDDFRQTEYFTRRQYSRLERTVQTSYNDDNSSTTVETSYSYTPLLRTGDNTLTTHGTAPGTSFPAMGSILSARLISVCIDGDSGRTYRRCSVFPEDYAGNAVPQYIADLKTRNFRLPVGEEIYWKGNPTTPSGSDIVDGRFIHYARFQPSGSSNVYILPHQQWTYRNRQYARRSSVGNNEIPDGTIGAYDVFGNPTQVQEAGGPVTSYVWGYSGLYPVAEIIGKNISDVMSFRFSSDGLLLSLGTYIGTDLTQHSPSSRLWTGLSSLRNSSSGVLVTTRMYEPLIGPKEVTDPSGKAAISSYDNAGRLSQSRMRAAGETGNGLAVANWIYDFLRTDGSTNSITQRVFTDASGSLSNARTTVSRFDGLGRSVQTSLVGASPSSGDIVQPFISDFLDREDVKTFLPYRESSSNAGAYRSNAITSQSAWYDVQYGSGMGNKAFATKEYENSRRERVKASVLPGHVATTRTVVSTALSSSKEVLRLEYSSSSSSIVIHASRWWPAGRFTKTTTTGPDGSVTEVFTNEFGSTVLERRLINASNRACTYFVRDNRDRVVCIIPPDIVQNLETASSSSISTDGCYVYVYDNLDRVITRKLPKSTATVYTYRPDGQILTETTCSRVLTNGYDSLGRITSRKYKHGSSGAEVTLAEYGYDSYPSSSLSGLTFVAESGFDQSNSSYVKGLKIWEHVYALDPDKSESSYGTSMGTMVTRAFFYDAKGRLIQTAEKNILGQTSRISMKYDFNDNPVSVKESHAVSSSLSVSATTVMTYDREGRQTSSVTTLGAVTSRATYQYDALGRLLSKTLGAASSPAAVVTDSFTIQGWLKQRTSANFTSQLQYETPTHASTPSAPGLTGNITEWRTYRNGSAANGSTYAFTYDLLSRLTSSQRYSGNSSTASNPYTEQGITFDKAGKVLSLSRYGASASDCEQINLVTDNNLYDQYHNITRDAYSGASMEWNILNLVRKVTPSGGSVAKYTFLADGTKVKVNSSSGTYLYLGSMVFSIPASGSPVFESMSVAEGRIIATSSGNEARYFITDHLGSVRTVLKADGTVVAENDFYPFGKRIPTGAAGGNAYRHTFSGKEDQSSTPAGSPYLDFGARMYSPDTARWLSVDPMAEKYYGIGTHVYCAGNPVNMVDLDGNDPKRRIAAARSLIGISYSQDTGELRTGLSKEALSGMDCSEFVNRVLFADKITDSVLPQNTFAMVSFFGDESRFVKDSRPKIGDIALWEGHVGIVSEVGENDTVKIIHASGVGKLSYENPICIPVRQYRNSTFIGYFRPREEHNVVYVSETELDSSHIFGEAKPLKIFKIYAEIQN